MRTGSIVLIVLTLPLAAHATVPSHAPKDLSKIFSGHTLDIVTIADPGARHPCKIKFRTESTILCQGQHHHPAKSYALEEIAAIIEPPTHSFLWQSIGGAIAGGALIASAFFVPITAVAIILQVTGGFILLADWATSDLSARNDHSDDLFLYQRPNTPLTITLNTSK